MSGKVAFVGDCHFGARNSSLQYHTYFEKFYKDFFEYVDANDIKVFLQTGDIFDVRRTINTWTLEFFHRVFVDEVIKRNLHVYIIVGNHDLYYLNSLEIHTPGLVLKEYKKNFTVIDVPTDIEVEGHSFLMVPWITKLNADDVVKSVKKSKSTYCLGHFEFNGFQMHRGTLAKSHFNHSSFSKFKTVFSGHFHTRSEKDNVLYLGTPYEITWIDCNDQKGFHVLDAEGNIEFIKNKHSIHTILQYPDIKDVKDQYVRIMLNERPEPKELQKYKDKIDAMFPHDVKYQEKFQETYASSVNMDKIATTEELIFEFIDSSEIDIDKDGLKTYMSTLYSRAGELV